MNDFSMMPRGAGVDDLLLGMDDVVTAAVGMSHRNRKYRILPRKCVRRNVNDDDCAQCVIMHLIDQHIRPTVIPLFSP